MSQDFKALATAASIAAAGISLLAQAQAQAQASRPPVTMASTSVPIKTLAPVVRGVEALTFTGSAAIQSRVAPDAEFGQPTLILLFDLTGITGRGAKSGLLFRALSQEYVVLPNASNQTVAFTVPMASDPDAPLTLVRTADARFVMNVDPSTGALTSVGAVFTPR